MKTPFDFCHVYVDGDVIELKQYLVDENIHPTFCGLTAVPHFKNCYSLFFDYSARTGYPSKGFRGICDYKEILTSTIPKGLSAVAILSFDEVEFHAYARSFAKVMNGGLKILDQEDHGDNLVNTITKK